MIMDPKAITPAQIWEQKKIISKPPNPPPDSELIPYLNSWRYNI